MHYWVLCVHLTQERATVVSVAFERAPELSVLRCRIDTSAIQLTSSDGRVITIPVTFVRIGFITQSAPAMGVELESESAGTYYSLIVH